MERFQEIKKTRYWNKWEERGMMLLRILLFPIICPLKLLKTLFTWTYTWTDYDKFFAQMIERLK